MLGHNNLISGAFWISIAAAFSKVISLLTQVILGWVLTKEEFGLFAIVLSIGLSISVLRNGGTQQILIQRGDEYEYLAPIILRLSLAFNVIAALILIIIAPFAASYYKAPELSWMLVLLSISVILTTPSFVLRSRLSINHYFRKLGIVDVTSNLVRQSLTIALALTGFGAFSFIVPIVIEPVVIALMAFWFLREWPEYKRGNRNDYKNILLSSRWVMLATLAMAVIQNGQYFIISLFEDRSTLGVYFFAMQLISSGIILFTTVFESVIFPGFSSVKGNASDLKGMVVKAIRLTVLFILPVVFITFLLANHFIHFVWAGKWDDAIGIVRSLLISVPAMLLISLSVITLQAKGMWKTRLICMSLFAIGDMLVALLCIIYSDIYTLAVATSVYRWAFCFIQIYYILKLIDVGLKEFALSFSRIGMRILGSIILIYAYSMFFLIESTAINLFVICFLFCIVYFFPVLKDIAVNRRFALKKMLTGSTNGL